MIGRVQELTDEAAKLRGLKRSAAVVLGNVGTADDVEVLTPTEDN